MTESFNTTEKAVKQFRNAVMLEKIKGVEITKDYVYNLFIDKFATNPTEVLNKLKQIK